MRTQAESLCHHLLIALILCLALVPAASAQEPSNTPMGQVTIDTVPSRLDVSIDGKARGSSPVKTLLAEGAHNYSVQCPERGEWKRDFEVAAGEIRSYTVTCPTAIHPSGFSKGEPAERAENFSVVTAPAGIKVWIDGKARGASPLNLNLPPGRHKLSLRCPGLEDPTEFKIDGDRVRSFLLPCNGSLNRAGLSDLVIQTDPPGQRVLIDGASRGPSPAEISLSPGSHTYTVECPNTGRFERSFTLVPGRTRTYAVNCSGE